MHPLKCSILHTDKRQTGGHRSTEGSRNHCCLESDSALKQVQVLYRSTVECRSAARPQAIRDRSHGFVVHAATNIEQQCPNRHAALTQRDTDRETPASRVLSRCPTSLRRIALLQAYISRVYYSGKRKCGKWPFRFG